MLPVLESGEETLVGGQAVMEGVMMRAPHSYCVAVRKPNGELVTEERSIPRMSEKYPIFKWPILRGLGTLALRIERASANALTVARLLGEARAVAAVYYPGLPDHPDHELARRQFGDRFGSIVSFTLRGGTDAARAFMAGGYE